MIECDPSDAQPVGSSAVTVLVIAKEPVAGRVKTRLCPPCTFEQAAQLAESALRDTLDAVAAARVARRVVVLDGAAGDWVPPGFEVCAQVAGGLGNRIDAAFAEVDGPAIVIGMDTPQLGADSIEAAADALCRPGVDAVLGPALDGGYWTIGFRRRVGGAFDGVPMSTEGTLFAQLRRLERLGLEVAIVHPLRDIDCWNDALEVAQTHPQLRVSRTARLFGSRVGSGVGR